MNDVVFSGGQVVLGDRLERADVGVSGGLVAEIGTDVSGRVLVDCSGSWVGPGLVDLHVHLREPGQEWKEDVASGSRAAALGGFTAVVAMPNTIPATDAGHLARYIAERGRHVGLVDVVPAGAITLGRQGSHLAHLDELWSAGVRVFSDDGDVVADAGLLRRAMDYLAELGGVVAQHAEDAGLSRGGHVHEGAVSAALGIAGTPRQAEEVIVARDLALVGLTGARYHVQHVSSAGTVELVAAAKRNGLPVTAEVTPHHLAFDHEAVRETDPVYKMFPPLRAPEDVAALREALEAGTIDAVATDHAPHADHEKDVPFEEAPRGVIGLETAMGVVLGNTTLDGPSLFDRMSSRPAAIARLVDHGAIAVGRPANVTVIDPAAEWVVDGFESKSRNSPFIGRRLRGRVLHTMHAGNLVVRDGKLQ